jgi:hypothetical protein
MNLMQSSVVASAVASNSKQRGGWSRESIWSV